MNIIPKPPKNEYAPEFEGYIDQVPSDNIFEVLGVQKESFKNFIKNIPEAKADHRYAENKWTVKEVVGHIIDTERVMAYRALAISRGEQQDLPGLDENEYVAGTNFKERSLDGLAEEFELVRASNYKLIESFDQEMLERSGKANGENCSVRALVYIIAGHLQHHLGILKERYGC